jgi:hypothetical protein
MENTGVTSFMLAEISIADPFRLQDKISQNSCAREIRFWPDVKVQVDVFQVNTRPRRSCSYTATRS